MLSICISCTQQTLSSKNDSMIISPDDKACYPQIESVTAKMDGRDYQNVSDSLSNSIIKLPNELNDGETLMDFILEQPGVKKDDDGNIILVSGKKVTPKDMENIEKWQFYK